MLSCTTVGDVLAFIRSKNGDKLYFYTNRNHIYSFDLGGVRNITDHDDVQVIRSLVEKNTKVKPPVDVFKFLVMALKCGDIYKLDPSDPDKRELIASLEGGINQMEIEHESKLLFVLCKGGTLFQIDLTGKERIFQIHLEIGT